MNDLGSFVKAIRKVSTHLTEFEPVRILFYFEQITCLCNEGVRLQSMLSTIVINNSKLWTVTCWWEPARIIIRISHGGTKGTGIYQTPELVDHRDTVSAWSEGAYPQSIWINYADCKGELLLYPLHLQCLRAWRFLSFKDLRSLHFSMCCTLTVYFSMVLAFSDIRNL